MEMKGQMKIQQMAFMIVAVFFFFILVGLFFLGIQFSKINSSAAQLEKEQAISSLSVIADMPEFNFDSSESFTLDEDKLKILSGNFSSGYEELWPVASIEVYKVYPSSGEVVDCPGVGCNYYKIFDNGQSNIKKYSTFVSVCNKINEGGVYDVCDIGKLVVGVRINEG